MRRSQRHQCGLGWSGFRSRPAPILWVILFGSFVLISVLWSHRDVLINAPVDQKTMFALYGVIGVLLRPALRVFRSDRRMREVGLRQGVLIFLVGSLTASLFIFLSLPPGSPREVLVVMAGIFFLASTVWFVFSDGIRTLGTRIRQQFSIDSESRWRGSSLAWIPDLGMWVLLTIGAALLTASVSRIASVFTVHDPNGLVAVSRYAPIVAAVTCYLYQTVGTYSGGTFGQCLFGVRIVRQDDFEPISLRHAFIRTLVVSAPTLAFLVLVAIGSESPINDKYSLQDYAGIAAASVLILGITVKAISISLIRQEHPHGQGLMDLFIRTICVPRELVGQPCPCNIGSD